MRYFTSFRLSHDLENQGMTYTYSTFQFRLARFQVLQRYLWLAPAVLGRTEPGHLHGPRKCPQVLPPPSALPLAPEASTVLRSSIRDQSCLFRDLT